MTNNIIDFNQQVKLEAQLKSDAGDLDDNIPPRLRAQLLEKLSNQTIQSQNIQSQAISHSTSSLIKNKLAIAASLVLTFFVVQIVMNQQAEQKPQLAINQNSPGLNKMLSGLTGDFKNKELLASQNLNNEYKALIADMEKVKQRIIRL